MFSNMFINRPFLSLFCCILKSLMFLEFPVSNSLTRILDGHEHNAGYVVGGPRGSTLGRSEAGQVI